MAVDPSRQKQGLGGAILIEVIEHCRKRLGGRVMWCNARSAVVDFYRNHGFQTVSDEFMIENVGPHYVMVRELA